MADPARKRARNPKSRTGCVTCKIRRIKCGEEKPHCKRCTSTGRTCDGYAKRKEELPWDVTIVRSNNALGAPLEICGNPVDAIGDELERQGFEFFRRKTSIQMSGFFHSSFWNGLILQASHTEPAILHAVIALGSLHRMNQDDKSISSDSTEALAKKQFTLQQSNKAIACLLRPETSGISLSEQSMLMACLLFICLETFQGNHNAAMTHLESGLKILRSLEKGESEPDSRFVPRQDRDFIQDNLAPLFSHLDMQASTYFPSRILQCDAKSEARKQQPDVAMFFSIAEANDHLQSQVHLALQCLQLIGRSRASGSNQASSNEPVILPDTLLNAHHERSKQLSQWLVRFNEYLAIPKLYFKPQDLRCAILLKMQHLTVSIILASSLFVNQGEYDKLIPDFERVTTLAETLLASCPTATRGATCSFDMGVIPSLFNTGCRCRDPMIRRRAIKLLSASSRFEGIWDSEVSAAIARWVMGCEEEGLGEVESAASVPVAVRVHMVDKVLVSGERKCLLKYWKGNSGVKEAVITW